MKKKDVGYVVRVKGISLHFSLTESTPWTSLFDATSLSLLELSPDLIESAFAAHCVGCRIGMGWPVISLRWGVVEGLQVLCHGSHGTPGGDHESGGSIRGLPCDLRAQLQFGQGADCEQVTHGEDAVSGTARCLEVCRVLLHILGASFVGAEDARVAIGRLALHALLLRSTTSRVRSDARAAAELVSVPRAGLPQWPGMVGTATRPGGAHGLKAYRTAEGNPDAPPAWRQLRKSVADIGRLTELSQASNVRYLEALAATAATTPLGQLTRPVCRPVRTKTRRARALNPFASDDAQLLEAVAHGEFAIQGFRNRDIRALVFGFLPNNPQDAKRQSANITRRLGLLKTHGLIKKVPHSHRYKLTRYGQTAVIALLNARQADTKKLAQIAA